MIASAGGAILPEFLPGKLHQEGVAELDVTAEVDPTSEMDWQSLADFVEAAAAKGETDIYRRVLDRFDRLVVSSVMRRAGGQQNRAAEILGLSRVTLRSKLRHMRT